MSGYFIIGIESELNLKTDWGDIVIRNKSNVGDSMKHVVELHSPVITYMHWDKLCPS